MDTLTPEARSALMARIRSKGTLPERQAARLVRSLGIECQVWRNCKGLPGSPDLVVKEPTGTGGLAVFVHGCFWHGCRCRGARAPRTRRVYWRRKIERNRARDAKVSRALRRLGWSVVVVWEHELRTVGDRMTVRRRIARAWKSRGRA